MNHLPIGTIVLKNDRLRIVWKLPNGECRIQRKRIPKSCPLTKEEIRLYCDHGLVVAIKHAKKSRNLTLRETMDLFRWRYYPDHRFSERGPD